MDFRCVKAVFFSPTGTTGKVVNQIADGLAETMGISKETIDFTLPAGREKPLRFSEGELIVFGTPVYAGRVPNVLLKFLRTIEGNGAIAVPVVVFGNRWYDYALEELSALLSQGGMKPVAAGAFVGEHAFSDVLGRGRPDRGDLNKATRFAIEIAEMLKSAPEEISEVTFEQASIDWVYYQPRDEKENPIDIRKVKSVVSDNCINCGVCAAVCPMGSIHAEDVTQYTGICIKCGACIKQCPQKARSYSDPGYLYHKEDLERRYTMRQEPAWFLGQKT